ncbi:hypothetical protein [Lysobacter sp. HA35]
MKRQLLGALAAVVVYAAVQMALRPLGQMPWLGLEPRFYPWAIAGYSATPYFVAMLVGGWLARRRFLPWAMMLWLLPSLFVLVWSYRIQSVALPISAGTFLSIQLPVLAFTFAATLVGAWLGGGLSRVSRQKPNTSSKPTPLRGAA